MLLLVRAACSRYPAAQAVFSWEIASLASSRFPYTEHALQALEKVPGIHLVNQIIKQKAKKTGGRSAPQGLSGWAKAQMMMIYAIEHDEMWCHKGFLQASKGLSN